MKRINKIEKTLIDLYGPEMKGVTAQEISAVLSVHRTNVSSDLNILVRKGSVKKIPGRPVRYEPMPHYFDHHPGYDGIFEEVIGGSGSLFTSIQQAKAAIVYPPRGLHTLILGGTGVGKTMFAELMFQYGKEMKRFPADAPFITFNCADYAKNAQLLMGQIFGIKKGAYTGADSDQEGLLEKATRGVLFLDEVHRLPAEGQEMMFTFIDKGIFRRLGEVEHRKAEVLIIAATTAEPRSHLLDTFLRRIPMVINMPSLDERSLQERFYLVRSFFRQESLRLGKEIHVSPDAVKSFLLYHCPNNIGQLKSDIQLSCARAFLEYVSQRQGRVYVNSKILPEGVKGGILRLKAFRDEIDKLLDGAVYDFVFSSASGDVLPEKEASDVMPYNFYEFIERKMAALKRDGVGQEQITGIIGSEIERSFAHYVGDVRSRLNSKGVEGMIGKDIYGLAGAAVELAVERLQRPELKDIRLVLALHIKAARERVMQNQRIYNPNLNEIRMKYPEEFLTAVEMAKLIEEKLAIALPIDEIGFLTMFVATRHFQCERQGLPQNVGILLLMHGNSTAASLARLVNDLLAAEVVFPIDMPAAADPEDIFEAALLKTKEIDRGAGVLVLADMGSLVSFGDIIAKETGIMTKTVEMASTPMILEAARKSMQGGDLEQVYNASIDINPYLGKRIINPTEYETSRQAGMIVTGCYSGEGSSVKIKSLLLKNLDLSGREIEIVNLSFVHAEDFRKQLNMLNAMKPVLAVVSFIDPQIPGIPFFSIESVFSREGLGRLQKIVSQNEIQLQLSEILASNLQVPNAKSLFAAIKSAMEKIKVDLGKEMNEDVFNGTILHVGCMIESILLHKAEPGFKNLKTFRDENKKLFSTVKKHFGSLESLYGIRISENYLATVVEVLVNN